MLRRIVIGIIGGVIGISVAHADPIRQLPTASDAVSLLVGHAVANARAEKNGTISVYGQVMCQPAAIHFGTDRVTGTIGGRIVDLHLVERETEIEIRGLFLGNLVHVRADPKTSHGYFGLWSLGGGNLCSSLAPGSAFHRR